MCEGGRNTLWLVQVEDVRTRLCRVLNWGGTTDTSRNSRSAVHTACSPRSKRACGSRGADDIRKDDASHHLGSSDVTYVGIFKLPLHYKKKNTGTKHFKIIAANCRGNTSVKYLNCFSYSFTLETV